MKYLIGCEFSGRVRDAFRKKGIEAWSCDIDNCNPSEYEKYHIKGDILDVIQDGWDVLIAFPPCTYLTLAGNRWYTKDDPRKLAAMDFVLKLWNSGINHIAIENPVGSLNTHWRKPSQIIHPWQYGHPEKKRTCLWEKRLPKLRPTNIVTPHPESKIVRYSGEYGNVKKVRSLTYTGIAEAMAEQWQPEKILPLRDLPERNS